MAIEIGYVFRSLPGLNCASVETRARLERGFNSRSLTTNKIYTHYTSEYSEYCGFIESIHIDSNNVNGFFIIRVSLHEALVVRVMQRRMTLDFWPILSSFDLELLGGVMIPTHVELMSVLADPLPDDPGAFEISFDFPDKLEDISGANALSKFTLEV